MRTKTEPNVRISMLPDPMMLLELTLKENEKLRQEIRRLKGK